MTDETPRTPPGWYPDPLVGGQQRYWDGNSWTEHVAPLYAPPPRPPRPPVYAQPPSEPPPEQSPEERRAVVLKNRRALLIIGGAVVLLIATAIVVNALQGPSATVKFRRVTDTLQADFSDIETAITHGDVPALRTACSNLATHARNSRNSAPSSKPAVVTQFRAALDDYEAAANECQDALRGDPLSAEGQAALDRAGNDLRGATGRLAAATDALNSP